MTMKKLVLGLTAMFLAAVSIQSCSQGKSDDQIKKEAEAQFANDKEALTQQADAECQKVVDTKYEEIKKQEEEKAKEEDTKKKGK